MPAITYKDLANDIIKDFIKAVVLIDDHWSTQNNNIDETQQLDPSSTKLNTEDQSIPPGNDDKIVNAESENKTPTTPQKTTDSAYLKEIENSITNQGFLFTGYAYTDASSNTAFKLAAKADILILDWFLGTESSAQALDLLKSIGKMGAPRFVFILTDQTDFDVIKNQIAKHLDDEIGNVKESTFECGVFSFSIKNKPQAGGDNTVEADKILVEAVDGIREQFGGLLQIAALQLLSNFREVQHKALSHFQSKLDIPFVAEWMEADSPIGPNFLFSSLMLDEWKSFVEESTSNSILSNQGISAFIKSKATSFVRGKESAQTVKVLLPSKKQNNFPSADDKIKAIENEIINWMISNDGTKWPTLTEPKGITWDPKSIRTITWAYLSIASENQLTHHKQLLSLDSFFHSQSLLPEKLSQGTILQRVSDNKYLICITPSCDCANPEKRINFQYSFLLAKEINFSKGIPVKEEALLSFRNKNGTSILLEVITKPIVSFLVKHQNYNSNNCLNLMHIFGDKKYFRVKPVAQLRPTRIQALVSLAAGNAIIVGLNRSEILRQACKK